MRFLARSFAGFRTYPMPTSNTTKILGGVLLIGLIVAAVSWYFYIQPPRPAPSAPGYYMGPLRAKGNPNSVGTEDGQKVTLPPLPESSSSQPGEQDTKAGNKGAGKK